MTDVLLAKTVRIALFSRRSSYFMPSTPLTPSHPSLAKSHNSSTIPGIFGNGTSERRRIRHLLVAIVIADRKVTTDSSIHLSNIPNHVVHAETAEEWQPKRRVFQVKAKVEAENVELNAFL